MGYVHDTHMSQFIPPTAMHYVTGTWTDAAGQVAGTIAHHKAANAETSVINVPIMIPSNSAALKGSKLTSVEFDYEILAAAVTSVTASMNKITRGADGADAAATAVTVSQDLTAATDAADVDEHRLTVTVTTPAWIDNDEYYLLVITIVAGGVATVDVLGAVANFTLRV
jgi:hypothetical protein